MQPASEYTGSLASVRSLLCSSVTGSLRGIGRSLYITGIKVYPQFVIVQRLGGGESAFDISCGLSGITFEVPGGLDQIPLRNHCVCYLDN